MTAPSSTIRMITLAEPFTFRNDMPRKKFIHGLEAFEITRNEEFIWVQKVSYDANKVHTVTEELGTHISNVASIARALPEAHVPEDDETKLAAEFPPIPSGTEPRRSPAPQVRARP